VAESLVSIGIPTFNRAERLARAAASALAQTYSNIELVISDNGSTDATDELCRRLAARDPRVRYLRSPVNRGLTENFNVLYREMRGDYVLTLSDDDWLAADYIERCLSAVGEHVLVCGLARYVDEAGDVVRTARPMRFEQRDPATRIRAYLSAVDENAILYGVVPRAVMTRAAPMRNVLANDWLVVAAILAQGTAVTQVETAVYRQLGGTSASFPKLVDTLGLPRWHARLPHLVIAREVLVEIAWRGRAFRAIPNRLALAVRSAGSVIDWASIAWHLTLPTFAGLGRRKRGRWLWLSYQRFTRMLGAGWTRD
jgi:glycosyltransferase involved in cell wall biosynthesis